MVSKVQPGCRLLNRWPGKPGDEVELFWLFEQNGRTIAEHFTRFTAKYCLKTSQEQQEDNSTDNICYLEYICRPEQTLKFPIKRCLIDFNFHRPRLACFSLFLNWELFWRNNKTIIEFGFRRIWRTLQISEGVIHLAIRPRWMTPASAYFFMSYSASCNNV